MKPYDPTSMKTSTVYSLYSSIYKFIVLKLRLVHKVFVGLGVYCKDEFCNNLFFQYCHDHEQQ